MVPCGIPARDITCCAYLGHSAVHTHFCSLALISHHCLLRAIHCALSQSHIVANLVYGVHHSLAGDGVPTVNCMPASFHAYCSAGDAVLIHHGLLFFARAWFGN